MYYVIHVVHAIHFFLKLVFKNLYFTYYKSLHKYQIKLTDSCYNCNPKLEILYQFTLYDEIMVTFLSKPACVLQVIRM